MCYKGYIGNFSYEKQKDGTFLYKAKEGVEQKKITDAKYQEKPQYPLIEQYENKAVERFQVDLKNTVTQVVQFLIKTNHEQ